MFMDTIKGTINHNVKLMKVKLCFTKHCTTKITPILHASDVTFVILCVGLNLTYVNLTSLIDCTIFCEKDLNT